MSNTEKHRKSLALALALVVLALTIFIAVVGNYIIEIYTIAERTEARISGGGTISYADLDAVVDAKIKLRRTIYAVVALLFFISVFGIYLLYYIRKLKVVVRQDVAAECLRYSG